MVQNALRKSAVDCVSAERADVVVWVYGRKFTRFGVCV